MKKLLLSLLLTTSIATVYGQAFSENMGTISSSPRTISAHNTAGGWQNSATLTFSGSANLSTGFSSSGYVGASGEACVFFASNSTNDFIISGINTTSVTSPALSFGIRKDNTSGNETGIVAEWSTDNWTTANPLSYSSIPSGAGTTGWYYRIISGLPSSATLSIRFRATNIITGNAYRIDDVSVNSLAVLPVQITNFTAKTNLQNIDLAWTTISEKDNSHFEILRSGDGKTFAKIGEVAGRGTTEIAYNYTFTDKNSLPGLNYYQLKQVDMNGAPTLFGVEAVKSNVTASNFKVAANKQDGTVKLTVFAASQGQATFKIYNLNGRKISERKLSLNKGYSNISIPFIGGSGLHIASLTTATETITQKFIQ